MIVPFASSSPSQDLQEIQKVTLSKEEAIDHQKIHHIRKAGNGMKEINTKIVQTIKEIGAIEERKVKGEAKGNSIEMETDQTESLEGTDRRATIEEVDNLVGERLKMEGQKIVEKREMKDGKERRKKLKDGKNQNIGKRRQTTRKSTIDRLQHIVNL